MGPLRSLTAVPLLCLLAACGSAAGNSSNAAGAPVSAAAVTSTALAPTADPTAFKLGAVLATIQYWDGSRPFMNLVYGGSWQMAGSGGAEDLPAQYLDSNGWVKSLPAGYRVIRALSIPVAGGNFICRFQGNGQLQVAGPSVTNLSMGSGQSTFTLAAGYPRRSAELHSVQRRPDQLHPQHRLPRDVGVDDGDVLARIPVNREWLQGPAVREVDAIGRVRIQAIPVNRSQRRTSPGRHGTSLEMAIISKTMACPSK